MPTLIPPAAARCCLFTELPSLSALEEDRADGQDGFRRRQPQAHRLLAPTQGLVQDWAVRREGGKGGGQAERLLAPAQGLVQDWAAERGGGSVHMISGMARLPNHHMKGWVRPVMPGLLVPSPTRA